MYNIENFKKSIAIIRDCKAYVKNQFEGIRENSDFPSCIQLAFLSESRYPTTRGGCKYYLAIIQGDLKVKEFFNDGYDSAKEICAVTSDSGDKLDRNHSRYAYNDTEQGTIDTALVLVNTWDRTKTRIAEAIAKYHKSVQENSDILDNFKL